MITLAAVRRALRDHRPQVADAPDARPAAVALVLLEGPQGLELILIKRAERGDDPWSGQIALPGGRYEGGDRDLEATAVRETSEETGVDLAGAERLGDSTEPWHIPAPYQERSCCRRHRHREASPVLLADDRRSANSASPLAARNGTSA